MHTNLLYLSYFEIYVADVVVVVVVDECVVVGDTRVVVLVFIVSSVVKYRILECLS